ncbi:MAG: MFS transporter, partial [Rhizobiales bacterium]|nr:MFS transporter [Hyphomicrobiales bacterium]
GPVRLWGSVSFIAANLGAASATLRWTLMAFDPPFALLPWLQLLHGLSFGATHLAAIYYVAGAAAPGRAASAQGLLAWTNGLVMAAAMMAAGFLYKAHGAAAYGAMAMLAAAGAVWAIAATRVRHAG